MNCRFALPLTAALLTALFTPVVLAADAPHAFTIDDLLQVQRVGNPTVSPDGRSIVFTVTTPDVAANKSRTDLYIRSVQGLDAPRRLTTHEASDNSPSWASDSTQVYFLSSRSGSNQLWRIAVNGGEAEQVSRYPLDIQAYKLSPQTDSVLLSFEINESCKTIACELEFEQKKSTTKASGFQHTKLFIRHWDTWKDGHIGKLFVDTIADGKLKQEPVLAADIDADVPSKPHGGDEEWSFAPDGKTAYFTARLKGKTEAWSTNLDIYSVDLSSKQLSNLTEDNRAMDTQPVASPDGKSIAWLAMSKPMFESDKLRVMVRDLKTGVTRDISATLDRSMGSLQWSADSKTLYGSADDLGNHTLFAFDVGTDKKAASVKRIVDKGYVAGFALSGKDIVFAHDTFSTPAEIFRLALNGGARTKLTHFNDALLSTVTMGEYSQFQFKGANDDTVYGYMVKPTNLKAGAKVPVALLVHGGPQTSFSNHFHYRWNAQTYAGQGFATVLIDFHGSPGYSQAFTDSISGDWGGKPFIDLQKSMSAVAQQFDFVDSTRACALGGSYGGYMMNWIAGNWPDGFKCIVDHAGIFDGRAMYYTTEEIWFDEWEHGGPHYTRPDAYEKHNPVNFVANWKTPMLVTHGLKDFRVPYTQGLGSFTALQRQGIASEMLIFPDENHWILKPQNSKQWHDAVMSWLHRWMDK